MPSLSAQKRALLATMLNQEGISAPEGIRRTTAEHPLSFAQQRLWFLDELDPGQSMFNLRTATRIRGPLDLSALEQSLSEIARRHDVLRATFRNQDGQPVQTVRAFTGSPLITKDLSGASEAEAIRLANEESERPFQLAERSLARVLLLRLDPEDHVLAVTFHHIVADAWSVGVFYRELAILYEAFAAGKPARLPDLPIQYGDFAAWQREWFTGETFRKQAEYWKRQLSGLSPLDLPTDRPRPANQTFRGAQHTFPIAPELTAQIKDFSLREGVTLFVTLLAAFQAVLARWSGQNDIAVGCTIAGRNRVETEPLIGPFVNMLVMRGDLSGDPTFRAFLQRVHETTLEAHAHQEMPFERLVEEIRWPRDLSRHPVFQVLLTLQNAAVGGLRLAGLEMSPVALRSRTSKFDLGLDIIEDANGLTCYLEYNADLFDAASAVRLGNHFRTLLESAINRADSAVSRLPLMTSSEREQMLFEWNDTHREYSKPASVYELFATRASMHPERLAAVSGDERISYGDLDLRASELASRLRDMGVGPDVLVGIAMNRGIPMLTALLACLKAGGAYLPLDPAFPQARLEFMIADSDLAVLITDEGIEQRRRAEPAADAGPENLAYVIYTSGSTGKPRAVMVSHRALANLLQSMRDEPGLTEADTLLAVTTLSFDIAGLELFLPLVTGACVAIASREAAMDAAKLFDEIERVGAPLMQATPATWRMLVGALPERKLRLRALCGGEALSRELADDLLARCSEVWNMYGPTETTIWSLVRRVKPGTGPLTIGRPIANTQVYILDSHNNLAPVGVAGELSIAGHGLSRGYLNRRELTAEKFVETPFGGRAYRTGDLALWRADGEVEYLGRIDYQVKVRGYRIELGEIEFVLRQHAGVREAVVMAREDVPGDTRLVAYIVPSNGTPPALAELRKHAAVQLPDYMLPSAAHYLDELPMTPNRKVDRKALPAPDRVQAAHDIAYAPPESYAEKAIATIWSELLQVAPIGRNSNFFDLGGHSLLLAKAHSRLRALFPAELSMTDLFRYPTVSALGEHVTSQSAAPEIKTRAERRLAAIERRNA